MAFKESVARVAKALSANRNRSSPAPLRVSEVMTKNVVTVYPGQSICEAVGIMANRPFRHIVVVHPNGRLAGVLSDRDLLRTMGAASGWEKKRVSDVMTQDVFTVSPDTPVSVAVREFLSRRINCLPVLYDENKQVCGILTSTDLLNVLANSEVLPDPTKH